MPLKSGACLQLTSGLNLLETQERKSSGFPWRLVSDGSDHWWQTGSRKPGDGTPLARCLLHNCLVTIRRILSFRDIEWYWAPNRMWKPQAKKGETSAMCSAVVDELVNLLARNWWQAAFVWRWKRSAGPWKCSQIHQEKSWFWRKRASTFGRTTWSSMKLRMKSKSLSIWNVCHQIGLVWGSCRLAWTSSSSYLKLRTLWRSSWQIQTWYIAWNTWGNAPNCGIIGLGFRISSAI